MQRLFNFCFEMEFFLKVAICCALVHQVIILAFGNFQPDLTTQVVLFWVASSTSFYGIGLLIEKVVKRNPRWHQRLTARIQPVKKTQRFPAFTVKGVLLGEGKTIIAAFIILSLAPPVDRGDSLLLACVWFFMRIFAADLCFYISHRLLHRKSLRRLHAKHHEFVDTSSFVAGHKSNVEYVLTTITDILPLFLLGCDIQQLLAWVIIGNAYNLEGHSSLSIFFISSDFHDLHHTRYKRNYGIHSFWDRVFGTLNTPTKRSGWLFPTGSLERWWRQRQPGDPS